jgi:hypothetical protein
MVDPRPYQTKLTGKFVESPMGSQALHSTLCSKIQNFASFFQKNIKKPPCSHWCIIQWRNISIQNTCIQATHKKQSVGSTTFQNYKIYQILLFLCSLKYQEFQIEILHSCRIHQGHLKKWNFKIWFWIFVKSRVAWSSASIFVHIWQICHTKMDILWYN